MRAADSPRRADLVALLRRLSPASLPPLVPAILPPFSAKIGAPLPRRPRALLFDLYGTLIASGAGGEPALAPAGGEGGAETGPGQAARALLEAELPGLGWTGGAPALARAFDKLVAASREAAIATRPFPEVEVRELISELLPGADGAGRERAALLLEAWRNPCAPMPGAAELLARLRASGLRLGIVSNAQFYTPLLFEALLGAPPEALGLEPGLSAYSYELGLGKPSPLPFIRAATPLREEGIAAGEILVLGNSYANDIAPAAALGHMTALFAGDGRSYRPGRGEAPLPDTLVLGLDRLETCFPG